jgi:hypothetical protein
MAAVIVSDCPRCRARNMTFDVRDEIPLPSQYEWQSWFEVFCRCRNCSKTTIFVIRQKEIRDRDFIKQNPPNKIVGSLNRYFDIDSFICIKDMGTAAPPIMSLIESPMHFERGQHRW